MTGLWPVFRKELADQFSSRRFFILFTLILLAGLTAIYSAAQSIRADISAAGADPRFVFLRLFTAFTETQSTLPSFVVFISFLGPLVGLALGFDAINSEFNRGTLSRLLAQPIYRDAVINGKFLARIATIAIMLVSIVLLVSGMGIRLIGVPPTAEEVLRLTAFIVVSIIFVSFWLALSVLLSLVFKQMATSALAGIAIWIVMTFFAGMLSGIAGELIFPEQSVRTPDQAVRYVEFQQAMQRVSPAVLYEEATRVVLTPSIRTLGISLLLTRNPSTIVLNPLPFSQSLMIVWPQIGMLVALTAICFGLGYVYFQRQEIRAP